jgi:hypothetical protein
MIRENPHRDYHVFSNIMNGPGLQAGDGRGDAIIGL